MPGVGQLIPRSPCESWLPALAAPTRYSPSLTASSNRYGT
jgi:hypothetical protein